MPSERHNRAEIVRYGKKIHQLGYVAATDGNLSVRLGPNRILATPTSMSKGSMAPKDMVMVDMAGKKISGRRNVSSEIGMHLLIYRLRPEVNAVVHAHPPTATGFAAAGMALDQALCSEVVITLGSIPLARYGCPGTKELADALAPLIPHHDAILMANHGVVTCGENLEHAFMNMETVEHFARIALVVHQLGRQQLLSGEDVNKLMAAREKYEATRNSALATKPGNGGNGDAQRRGRAARRQV